MSSFFSNIRSNLATRREERQAHDKLVRELQSYRTPAERAELDAILSRATGDTTEIDRILSMEAAPSRMSHI